MGYEIRQNLTSVNCEWGTNSPQWIVIHNTANGTSREGTAYANTQYFKNVNRSASAHYFVDDGDVIWQCVNDWDTAWHIGDSWSHNGATNYNAIGIEVCEQADGNFSDHEVAVLSWLVPMLMDKYGIPASRICRHFDVTEKNCPWFFTDQGRWNDLKARILSGEDDEVTPKDKLDIINGVAQQVIWGHYNVNGRDDWCLGGAVSNLPNKEAIAQQVVWGHYNVGGKDGWTVGGALENMPHEVWNEPIEKVRARDRSYGTDMASNGANNAIDEYMPKLMKKLDDIEKRLDKIESGK